MQTPCHFQIQKEYTVCTINPSQNLITILINTNTSKHKKGRDTTANLYNSYDDIQDYPIKVLKWISFK